MFAADFTLILYWWLLTGSLGIIFLPVTTYLFFSHVDKGYALSKVLAILILSYTVWLLGSLRLLPFNDLTLFLLIAFLAGANVFIAIKTGFFSSVKAHWKLFALEEILFIIGLLFWIFVRAHEPSIFGLEKYMDFGFINSILRSEYFPPKDMWLSGGNINYYYFGHLYAAVLTKLSRIDSVISYNLILATLFALTLTSSFSIGLNLFKSFKASKTIFVSGALSAFIATLAGNLHTIYIFFQSYTPFDKPVPFWQLPVMFNAAGYWYANATRFIPFTIHEFPIYSFVVADLHGHVFDIPFVLLAIALAIKIFLEEKLRSWDFILYGLLVAVMLMTNVLDGPIYLMLLTFILVIKHGRLAVKLFFPTFLLAIILSLPFWLNFKPFSQGVGILCVPRFLTNIGYIPPFIFEADHCSRSPVWMLFILYGFFYLALLGFIFTLNKSLKKTSFFNKSDQLVIIFSIFATVLIIIPELIYIKDIYTGHYRANTMFKFGYQAFIIFSLISGYVITRIITAEKFRFYKFYLLLPLFTFILISIFPYLAINSFYGGLKTYKGLDGLRYLEKDYPEDYKAIIWLRENVLGQPVILEAVGESYTSYSRVSANTGLPTVLGWPVHEWLWRGSYDEPGKRVEDVKNIYESSDLETTKKLLSKYSVSYVYLGTLEKEKYPLLHESKFIQLGEIIYDADSIKIYQINF